MIKSANIAGRFISFALCLTMLTITCACSKNGKDSSGSGSKHTASASSELSELLKSGYGSGESESSSSSYEQNPGTSASHTGSSATKSGSKKPLTSSVKPSESKVNPSNVSKAPEAKAPSDVKPAVSGLTPIKSTDFYGRVALAKLKHGSALIAAYDRIVQGVEACKTDISLNDKNNLITPDELKTVVNYYRNDYPHHFWLNAEKGYSYSSSGGKVYSVSFNYSATGSALSKKQDKFNAAVKSILGDISGSWNEYNREKAIHDRLAERVTYVESSNAHNAYGAIVEGKAVCEGYAKAFQYLCYQSGIQCLIASGTSVNPSAGASESHAWNIAKINNSYYHVDVTWDDQSEDLFYAYFNMSDSVIKKDHTVDASLGYSLPACNSMNESYFSKNGCTLKSPYSAATVANLLRSGNNTAHIYAPEGLDGFINWFNSNHGDVAKAVGISGSYGFSYSCIGNEAILSIQS